MKTKFGIGVIVVVVVVVVVVMGYVLLDQSKYAENQSTSSNERIKIAVSQTPLSSPFIIASHLDLFKKQKLNIELVPCVGGVACAKSLFNNEVEYATASESVVMFESFTHDDLLLISSFVESDNDVKLLTTENKNIRSISELKGKKVGVIKASASEFYFDSMLRVNNLQSMELERVYLPPQELSQALLDGDVDAISVWEPHGYLLMSSSENIVNLSLDGVYHLTFNLLARHSIESNYLNDSAKILMAIDESIQWIRSNPQDAQNIISDALEIPISQLKWSWDDYTFRLSIGNALLSNLQLQARWAVKLNLVEGEIPDYRKVLFPQALDKALHSPVGQE